MMSEPLVIVRSEPADMSDAELADLGITRVVTEYFEVGDYRYSKLVDAMAQVQRRVRIGAVKHMA